MFLIKVDVFFICMYVTTKCKPHLKGASCETDPSLPCECTNPFDPSSEHFFLGNADVNCKRAKVCYVKNQSGCTDTTQSRGGGRCQSKEACVLRTTPTPSTVSTPGSTKTLVTTVVSTSAKTVDGNAGGVSPKGVSEATSAAPMVEPGTTSVAPKGAPVSTSVVPETTSAAPHHVVFCECVVAAAERDPCLSKCEVDCNADCNDLTEEDGKCYSELATQEELLLECEDVKPTCPPAEAPGGDKICLCASDCIGDKTGECEVNCEADCNDIAKKEGKCYSNFACLPGLLFEEDC